MIVIPYVGNPSPVAGPAPAERTPQAAPAEPAAVGSPLAVRLDGRQLGRALVWFAAIVVMLGYGRELYVAHFGLETPLKNLRHFNMDSEGTLPAWFSSFMLVAAAALLAAVAGLSRRDRDADWRHWALLAGIFLYLSIDEAIAIHEILIKPLRSAFKLGGLLYFSWVLPAMVLVFALAVYLLPFLFRLPRRHALRFVMCGALFVGGALGMELVSGYFASRDGMEAPAYIAAAMVEETMEIAGSTSFVVALLAYLRERWGGWAVQVR